MTPRAVRHRLADLASFLGAEHLTMYAGCLAGVHWVRLQRGWATWLGSGFSMTSALADAKAKYAAYSTMEARSS